MSDSRKTEDDHLAETRERLIQAALPHVGFDGWSAETLSLAVRETGTDPSLARLVFPRGGVDMAIAFHRRADRLMVNELSDAALSNMRIRERVTYCVRRRIELIGGEREAVRRGAALFALPNYAPEGARLMWETADEIWLLCGDTSTDYNWYTKRAILSGVYSSTVLYWLGDQEPGSLATWDFLDRRIDDVMRFEKLKASLGDNPLARAAMALPKAVLGTLSAPGSR